MNFLQVQGDGLAQDVDFFSGNFSGDADGKTWMTMSRL